MFFFVGMVRINLEFTGVFSCYFSRKQLCSDKPSCVFRCLVHTAWLLDDCWWWRFKFCLLTNSNCFFFFIQRLNCWTVSIFDQIHPMSKSCAPIFSHSYWRTLSCLEFSWCLFLLPLFCFLFFYFIFFFFVGVTLNSSNHLKPKCKAKKKNENNKNQNSVNKRKPLNKLAEM